MRKLSQVGRQIRRPLKTVKEVPGPERVVYVDREKVVYRDRPDPEIFDEPEAPRPLEDLLRENESYGQGIDRMRREWVQLMGRMVDKNVTPLSDGERKLLKRYDRVFHNRDDDRSIEIT